MTHGNESAQILIFEVPGFPHFLTIVFLIWFAGFLMGSFAAATYSYYKAKREANGSDG